MNQTDFTYTLQQPQSITREQTNELKSIVEEFPYFQSARAMYLKGLKNAESFKYNQALKTIAAYTTDRSILFDFITSKDFLQNEISHFIKQNVSHLKDIDVDLEDISINKSVIIDPALKQHMQDTKEVLDPTLFVPKVDQNKMNQLTLNETNINKSDKATINEHSTTPEEILNLGKPLQFDRTESHSFNEWLNLTNFKPIERKEDKIESPSKKKEAKKEASLSRAKKFDLIERFITKSPKLEPVKTTTSNHNIAKAQMIQPEALMTETLARIYVEQKNYKKAIQSYKILSLKYPEKSGFFADQIKAVKQLQQQNNTE